MKFYLIIRINLKSKNLAIYDIKIMIKFGGITYQAKSKNKI